MKGKSNFGYKVLLFIALVAAIAHAGARGYRSPFDYDSPDPEPDSPAAAKPRTDTPPPKLKFPIYDKTGDPHVDQNPSSIDLSEPTNNKKTIEYDPQENKYYFYDKIGDQYLRNPTYMTPDEYLQFKGGQDEQSYWKRRLDALSLFNKKPELPQMYKEGIFDRIFGNSSIQVRPQGNVDVTLGGNWQNIKNPALVQRAQKYGVFDFDMQMNINLLATVGDKLKFNISNNTKATFDYQNMQKLEYTGKEDEIIKKIEAGNISFPLKSNLISGVQSLFGLKAQLQFGRLRVTGVISQQKSQRKSLTIQGGAQTQQFAIKADNYEENRDFLLAQYFRDNYNNALKEFPVINSLVTINKIEVWVSNSTGAVSGVRGVLNLMDLGEKKPYQNRFVDPTSQIQGSLPDNRSNALYNQLLQNPASRSQSTYTAAVSSLGLTQGQDYVYTTARKLSATEFSYNPQLGYILLTNQLNPNDALGVAFRYTYKGKVYQVGEFAEDLPPDTANQKVLFLKMLKSTVASPTLPIWGLMMKNVYALGGYGISKDNFLLNVMYQDPGGGEKRYIPDGPQAGVPLIKLLNLDRLNSQNEPSPDGVFDFVEGITINTQQGRVIFPVLEPFGSDLATALGNDPLVKRKYAYNVLYDSTKTIALQFQQNDRYILRGSYKSSSSSEIFLGGFNIPQGSVSVSAGGQKLVENQDFQIDYGLGKIKILNSGILNSGIPINVQYEDNSTFGFQQQNFMGARFDYYLNKKLSIGGTFMRLTERPFTQKVSFGDDPIKNTVLGLDANYQSEFPLLTRALDKLPIYSTTAPSLISVSGEVATLLPGHPQQINSLDPEGSVYIDDFEGTTSAYDLKFPPAAWSLASTPAGAVSKTGQVLFPEAASRNLDYGYNRAKLAWYFIEPTLVDDVSGVPGYVKRDPNQHYIRLVQQQEVFPTASANILQSALSTFDLGFYPNQKGPYNFDSRTSSVNPDGTLKAPESRWGGIMRPIDNTDFEASNVEFIQFWVMDPFLTNKTSSGGSLFINLGDVSEDVLKDSRMFFENGIPYPAQSSQIDATTWGNVPKFDQQITRAFDNDPNARAAQDVGYDGLSDADESTKFNAYITSIGNVVNPTVLQQIKADPSNDDYHYYRGADYDQQDLGVLARYKAYNNPQGNSPITGANAAYSSAATTIPESEDINRDNTLNEAESYYQYRIDFTTGMNVGTNNIINKETFTVKLPNGTYEPETWYQFKIPVKSYDHKIGGIADFRSIRFLRMFLSGFKDSTFLRFATFELGRNQWRTYQYSLANPGETVPQQNAATTDFSVASVSLNENSTRLPIPYVIPPGVNRQLASVSNGQNIQLNEQSLSLKVCGLKDGDARAVFKEVNVDMRQFKYLRLFMHAESQVGQAPVRDGDVKGFIRIGSDFTNNYYEYQVPLKVTPSGSNTPEVIWPTENEVNVLLQDLVDAKKTRDAKQYNMLVPFQVTDSKGNLIIVVGEPNIGNAKNIMLGVLNPKKTDQSPGDDGAPKCAEVWLNEMRMAGMDDHAGYAAAGKVNLQLADLGAMNFAGSYHSQGYGNIDQKINQRFQDDYYQYSAATNLSLGKLMPRSWGVQLPLFIGYTQNVSTPKYNPYDQDVLLADELSRAKNAAYRDSIRKAAQDFTSITSVNLTNIRVLGSPDKQSAFRMPWSIKNFDLSYSFNSQFKHNPTIAYDNLTTQKLGLGYTYSIKSKPLEPFKRSIKSKSKWYSLIRDFNINPLPSNLSFRSDMNRVMEETQVRNLDQGPYQIPSTFYKNFSWTRMYTLRWELTRSLSFDYSATNISRIDEPYGRIDTKSKTDSLWRAIETFGHNTSYTQTFNSSYNVPLQKLPLTDWISLRLGYSANYSWTGAAPIAYTLGNTIGNTSTKTVTGEVNFTQLYNKNRYLKALTQASGKPKSATTNQRGSDGLQTDLNRSVKDLRAVQKAGAADGVLNGNLSGLPGIKAGGAQVNQGGNTNNGPGSSNANGGTAPGKPAAGNPPPLTPDSTRNNNNNNSNNGNNSNGNSGTNGNNTTTAGNGKSQEPPITYPANFTNAQLDSLIKKRQEIKDSIVRAQKIAAKKARKAARKARRNTIPELNTTEKVIGRLLTMVTRGTLNYSENAGTILPGYLDSTRFMGVNNYSGAPGFNFVYGYQPTYTWLAQQAAAGRLSRDSLFNAQFQQTFSQNLNATATVQPIPDLRIDLTLTKTFSKSHSELYKDTGGATGFNHLNPYEVGSFNISYIAVNTLFKGSGVNTSVFNTFLANRHVISTRLGNSNPYTNGLPDPTDPTYKKGYTAYSPDVLIPAFIAAYTGKSADKQALINNDNSNIRSNPFKYMFPLPNWRITYNGLTKLPYFAHILSNLVINHAYTGSMSMNGFNSSLLYQDLYGLGFPSFIDSNSHNYIPFYQVPNVTISQAFNPLIGFDASFRNNVTARFEIRKSKTESLSLIDYQVSENSSTEYVIGAGYRKKGVKLPFSLFGVRKLKNELIVKLDIGLRDDKISNNFLSNNIGVVSSGQKVLRISPSIDYSVTSKLTLHFFYNRQQTIPYVSNSYPITTTQGGVTLRFIFAQ